MNWNGWLRRRVRKLHEEIENRILSIDELLRFKLSLEQQVESHRSRARGEAVRPGTTVESSQTGADLLSL